MTPLPLLIPVDLTPDEVRFLRTAVGCWGGPARCTDQMAQAIDFKDARDLAMQGGHLADLIQFARLTGDDWLRVLAAAELAFASRLNGCGIELEVLSGQSDAEALTCLRSVQFKLRRLLFKGHGHAIHPHRSGRPRHSPSRECIRLRRVEARITHGLMTRARQGASPLGLVQCLSDLLDVDVLSRFEFQHHFTQAFNLTLEVSRKAGAWHGFSDGDDLSNNAFATLLRPWIR